MALRAPLNAVALNPSAAIHPMCRDEADQSCGCQSDQLFLYSERSAVAGVPSGHADMYLVSLSQCERSRRNCRFKGGLLARVIVRSRSIVKHTPAVSFRYDPVFSDTHVGLRSHENAPALQPFQQVLRRVRVRRRLP